MQVRRLTASLILACTAPTLLAAMVPKQERADARDEADGDPRAWQQLAPYAPPDFEGYFPDDADGAAALDALIEKNTLRDLGDEEFLHTIRQGLRRTSNHRTSILSWVGNRMIWGVEEQHPDAIEMCYHAADYRELAAKYGARHHAVYIGLSVVHQKTPAILRTLADLSVAIDDPNDIRRVAWGARDQIDQLLPYLVPHLRSDDRWVREKAEAVQSIFRGELGAFEWAAERARQPARPRPWKELPEVRAALREGDSVGRAAVLTRIDREGLKADMNDSYLADFAVAATDPDPQVRQRIASLVGGHWIWNAGLHRVCDPAVDLILRMSRDADEEVRYRSVYYGLSTYRGERDDVLRRLVAMAVDPMNARSRGRIEWALKRHGDRLKALLDGDLRSDDVRRARQAWELYRAVFDERPPVIPQGIAGPRDLAGTWVVSVVAPRAIPLPFSPLTLVQDEADVVRLETATEAADGMGQDPLGDLAWADVGQVLYFSFVTSLEHAVIRSTGRLEGDHIEGTSRIDGQGELFVWTAARRSR